MAFSKAAIDRRLKAKSRTPGGPGDYNDRGDRSMVKSNKKSIMKKDSPQTSEIISNLKKINDRHNLTNKVLPGFSGNNKRRTQVKRNSMAKRRGGKFGPSGGGTW